MKNSKVLFAIYLLLSFPVFFFFKIELGTWISFFLSYTIITGIAFYHLSLEKTFSPFLSSYIIFNYLFFILAPIIQIISINQGTESFPNGLPYTSGRAIQANLLIALFNCTFFIFYVHYKSKMVTVNQVTRLPSSSNYFTPLVILVLLALCFMILGYTYSFLENEFIKPPYGKLSESVSYILFVKKILYLVPLGAIVVAKAYLNKNPNLSINKVLIFFSLLIFIVFLFVFKNPLTEKRNALGPIYITLLFILFPKVLKNNARFFFFMFISMVIFFPLMSALTHADAKLSQILANPDEMVIAYKRFGGILKSFDSLNYDAFSNVIVTIEYCSKFGISYGYQSLSALLFFVPRSIWPTKPISSGELIGDYLVDEKLFTFNNLSNPLVSEGYVNFGVFGVIIMAILLAYVTIVFMKWIQQKNPLKWTIGIYFSIHMLFLLRGDFTNGYTYFVGILIGIMFAPWGIEKILKYVVIKKENTEKDIDESRQT